MELREARAGYWVEAEQRVPKGYKQSEVGVIPGDWDASPLPNIVWFQEGPGLRNWQFKPSGLKVINVTNLQENGYLDLSRTERHISWEEFKTMYQHFLIDDGDVVVASSGNSYCKTAVVRQSDLPLLMNTSVIRFKAKKGIVRSYMLIYLKSKYFKDQIDLMITGGAQPNFGPVHLTRVLVPLPPTRAEQEAIAEALSDADALIESLEQLIAKKRQIKQGAMQELLTGKKRLPGFSEDWKEKPISSFSAFVTKGATPTTYGFSWQNNGVLFLRSECVSADGLDLAQSMFISETAHAALIRGEVRAGDILMTITGNVGRVVHLGTGFGVANINQHIARIRVNEPDVSSSFIFHWLSQLSVRAYYALITTGQAYPQISLKQVRETQVPLPSFPEQTAIAAILSDMDAEIAALEEKLAKTRSIKQGMIHNLLTGRIRLL
ncbi:MAG: restriction endonuclease subunit S [Methylobacter tundripaludum]|nr:restriction endonuclease subunit S [Methylobacter tundripaludum]